MQYLEVVTPSAINVEKSSFKVGAAQWTPIYGDIGSIPIESYFRKDNPRWKAQLSKTGLPMPRPGATVTVEGTVASLTRDTDKRLIHLNVEIENICFPTSARAPITQAVGELFLQSTVTFKCLSQCLSDLSLEPSRKRSKFSGWDDADSAPPAKAAKTSSTTASSSSSSGRNKT